MYLNCTLNRIGAAGSASPRRCVMPRKLLQPLCCSCQPLHGLPQGEMFSVNPAFAEVEAGEMREGKRAKDQVGWGCHRWCLF